MATIIVNGSSSGAAINNGTIVQVVNGGTTVDFRLNTGGSMTVSSNGTASNTVVSNGGWMHVSSGGVLSGITVSSGGIINGFSPVSAVMTVPAADGFSLHDVEVTSGNTAYLYSGQKATAISLKDASVLSVGSGGSISNIQASSGAVINLLNGANAANANLESGVILNGFTVQSRNLDIFNVTSAVTDTTANIYNRQKISSATVSGHGIVHVSSGGTLSTAAIAGIVNVSKGGTLLDADNTGTINLVSGFAGQVRNSGTVNVNVFGSASGFDQVNGGMLYIQNNALVSNARISGGSVVVSAGGRMDQVTMTSGTMFLSGSVSNFDVTKAKVSVGAIGGLFPDIYGKINTAVVNSGGSLMVKRGSLTDVTVNSAGLVSMGGSNTVTQLTVSDGGKVIANGDDDFSQTIVLSGGNLNGFTGVDRNEIESGIIHRNVHVSANTTAELYGGGTKTQAVSSGVVKSGGTIHLGGGNTASIADVTVENGGSIHVEKDAVLVLNGKTELQNGGAIILDRNIVHYADKYENLYDVYTSNVVTSCFSPVRNPTSAVISGHYLTRQKVEDDFPDESPANAFVLTVNPYVNTYTTTTSLVPEKHPFGYLPYNGEPTPFGPLPPKYQDDQIFVPFDTWISDDGLTKITLDSDIDHTYPRSVELENGAGQGRIRFDFTGDTGLKSNEAMLNDISLVSINDQGVDLKTLTYDQYHDDSRYEFVYDAALKDAYFIADGAGRFGIDQNLSEGSIVAFSDTFKIVNPAGGALIKNEQDALTQLNIYGHVGTWKDDGDITVKARLLLEGTKLYMELFRAETGSSVIYVPDEFSPNFDGNYFETEDTVFSEDKTYFTKAGGIYTAAAVTPGEAIAADTYYEKQYTNQDVVVTAQFSQNTMFYNSKTAPKSKVYSLDGGTNWQNYKVYSGVTFTQNGEVIIAGTGYGQDIANPTTRTVTVDWIDKWAPTLTAAQDVTDYTMDGVTITITALDSNQTGYDSISGVDWQRGIEYSIDDQNTWQAYNVETGLLRNDNGTVYFRAYDMAGNEGTVSHEVNNILRQDNLIDPVITSVTPETLTNGDVTISVTFDDRADMNQYKIGDNGEWTDWTGNYLGTFVAEENETYYFRSHYSIGFYSGVTDYEVTNIDKVAPLAPVVTADRPEELSFDPVILTATTNPETEEEFPTIKEFSVDNSTWELYSEPVAATVNGIYYFREKDQAGNISDVTPVTVANIAIANAPEAAPDTTEWTNQDVHITVGQATGSAMDLIYRYNLLNDDGSESDTWTTFVQADGFDVAANGQVKIQARWNAYEDVFYYSMPTTITVENTIDKVLPVIDGFTLDPDTWTNGNVAITILAADHPSAEGMKFPDASGIDSVEYSPDGTSGWTPVAQTEAGDWVYTAEDNGPYYFRTTDKAGNVSVVYYEEITTIDRIAPTIDSVTQSTDEPTIQDVILTITASDDQDGSGVNESGYEYLDGETWTALTGNTFTAELNGEYTFRVSDNAGNVSDTFTHTVTNINKTAPTIDSVTQDIDEWTTSDVVLTVNATDESGTGLDESSYQYLDGETWTAMTGNTFTAGERGEYTFRVANNLGNYSAAFTHTVTNIDKTAPTIASVAQSTEDWTNADVTLTISASDDEGGSGIDKYEYLNGSTWTAMSGNTFVAEASGDYTFRVTDKVGNISDEFTHTVGNIDKTAPVIQNVSQSTTAWTNQDVTLTVNATDEGGSGLNASGYEYLKGSTWTAMSGNTFVASENGDFTFRAKDNAGNISAQFKHTVGNIDKVPPAAPTASADITEPTDLTVSVTAVFSEDTAIGQYSLDNSVWQTYTGPVQFTENGKVYFRGIDQASNISETTSYTVLNIANQDYTWTPPEGSKNPTAVIQLDAPGRYQLSGQNLGNVNGTVTIYNGNKKVATVAITNGILDQTPFLLDSSKTTTLKVKIKDGNPGPYTLSLDASKLFCNGTHEDDVPDMNATGPTVSAPGDTLAEGWVGFSDSSSYQAFTLNSAAKINLTIKTSDAAKFTVYQKNGTRLKKVSGASYTINASDAAAVTFNTPKPLVLNAGTYFVAATSTNAKNGGDASFQVIVNDESTFFTKGDNTDDVYTAARDLGTVTGTGVLDVDWVGMGDVIDFRTITLETAAKLSFTVNSGDAAKFTIYQLNNGKLKSLQNTKINVPGAETKELQLNAGTYYLSMQSTNAKKGGNADYSIEVNSRSVFYPAGDHSNDTRQAAAAKPAVLPGEQITGWVGFSDPTDFIKFAVQQDGQIELNLDGVTAYDYNQKHLKLVCQNAAGKSVALESFGDTLVSKDVVAAGEYYLGVTCANVKKYDTAYAITVGGGMLA